MQNLLIIAFSLSSTLIIVNLVFPGIRPLSVILNLVVFNGIVIIAFILNFKDLTGIASILSITALLVLIGLNMIASRSVSDPGIITVPVVAFTGCLFLDKRGMVFIICTAMLMVLAIGLAEIFGLYETETPITIPILVIYIALLLGTSFIAWNIIGMSENYLSELKSKNGYIASQKNELQKQLDEKNVLMSELHHRVKNNMMIILSVLDSKIDLLESESSRHIFLDSIQRIEAMSRIHEKIYQSKSMIDININVYITDLIESYGTSFAIGKDIQYDLDIAHTKINMNKAVPLAMLLNELITNSLKYAFKNRDKGIIRISLLENGDKIHFSYEDDGPGFNPEKVRKEALGTVLITSLANQLEAKLETDFKERTFYELIFSANYIE